MPPAGVSSVPRALPYPDPPLSDGRIALRSWCDADAPRLVAAFRDPEIPRWTFIPAPYSERDAREFIARQRRDRDGGVALAFAIVPAHDEATVLGGTGLEPVDRVIGRGEIGYWVAREHRGRGIATAAVRLLAGWALSGLGLRRLEILAFRGNAASERVAQNAGFVRERLLPEHRLHPHSGEVRDMVLYALERDSGPRVT